eukprot:scaffold61697_cov22-Tisochrysis_lutea.AAC.2
MPCPWHLPKNQNHSIWRCAFAHDAALLLLLGRASVTLLDIWMQAFPASSNVVLALFFNGSAPVIGPSSARSQSIHGNQFTVSVGAGPHCCVLPSCMLGKFACPASLQI